MIVEGDKEKKSKKATLKNCENVPEELSCTKTPSVESSVKFPKLLPLAIRNKCYYSRNYYNSCFEW